jgi:hypothetical protein
MRNGRGFYQQGEATDLASGIAKRPRVVGIAEQIDRPSNPF